MRFCLFIFGFRSLNDRYLIREFKATSRIFRQCIEILCYGLQNVVILWDLIPLKYFSIIIHLHFCMEYYYYIL
jgi:hypothetical protein